MYIGKLCALSYNSIKTSRYFIIIDVVYLPTVGDKPPLRTVLFLTRSFTTGPVWMKKSTHRKLIVNFKCNSALKRASLDLYAR